VKNSWKKLTGSWERLAAGYILFYFKGVEVLPFPMGNHRPPQLFFFYFSVKLVIFIFLDFYSDASFSSSFPFFYLWVIMISWPRSDVLPFRLENYFTLTRVLASLEANLCNWPAVAVVVVLLIHKNRWPAVFSLFYFIFLNLSSQTFPAL
jgi:hypothetical protein